MMQPAPIRLGADQWLESAEGVMMDRDFVRLARGLLLSLVVALVCPQPRAALLQPSANPARTGTYLAVASTAGSKSFFNTVRLQAAGLDTSGQTVFYGAPYSAAYTDGGWPTVSIAIQMYWAAYQKYWGIYTCTYSVKYYDPESNNGGVVWADLANGCGGDGFIVYATRYVYDPHKNNGDPGGCCSAGASSL